MPSKQATACGMVIQELMANSIKYGAWSSDGVVHLGWRDPVRSVQGDSQVHTSLEGNWWAADHR